MENLVRLWLTEGIPYEFRNCPIVFEEIRAWLGRRLGVCPKVITIIGSARIGFSIAGAKYGRPFNSDSDLDLSIVSELLFERLSDTFTKWQSEYCGGIVHPRHEIERQLWDSNLEFGNRNIPAGFFDANKIPTYDRYPLIQDIQQAMWTLTRKLEVTPDLTPPRRSSVRVYKSWSILVSRLTISLFRTRHLIEGRTHR